MSLPLKWQGVSDVLIVVCLAVTFFTTPTVWWHAVAFGLMIPMQVFVLYARHRCDVLDREIEEVRAERAAIEKRIEVETKHIMLLDPSLWPKELQ